MVRRSTKYLTEFMGNPQLHRGSHALSMEFHAWMLHMVISMALHDLSMDIPWHSIYSDHTGKIRTMELTDFMGNPYIPHGIHVFLMEFHEFPMGYS